MAVQLAVHEAMPNLEPERYQRVGTIVAKAYHGANFAQRLNDLVTSVESNLDRQ